MKAKKHLSDNAKQIWNEYADVIVRSPGRKALFQTGLEALDRAEAARQIIEEEGMITITGKSGVAHAHPAIGIEKDSRSLALKVFKSLNIHMDHIWTKDLL